MTELVQEVSAEEVKRSYNAAMDSVNLLNAGKPVEMTEEDWADTKARNVAHLEIMVSKDFMQDQDLAPLQAAIAAGK